MLQLPLVVWHAVAKLEHLRALLLNVAPGCCSVTGALCGLTALTALSIRGHSGGGEGACIGLHELFASCIARMRGLVTLTLEVSSETYRHRQYRPGEAEETLKCIAATLPTLPLLESVNVCTPELGDSRPLTAAALSELRDCVKGLCRLRRFILSLAPVRIGRAGDLGMKWPKELLQALVTLPTLEEARLHPIVAKSGNCGRYFQLLALLSRPHGPT